MTSEAQNMLRHVIEDNNKYVRFCLVCNNISKLNEGLRSRCIKFRFGYLEKEDMYKKLHFICLNEDIQFTPNGLQNIVNISFGDLRKAINILQSTYITYNEITD